MTQSSKPLLDDDAVAEFLVDNRDFFERRPELVPDLAATDAEDDGGTVVPLAERQVAMLRQRNAALRKRMATLLRNARENEYTFASLRALTLAAMDAEDVEDVSRAIGEHLVGGLDVDHAVCFVQGGNGGGDCEHLLGVAGEPPVPRLFALTVPECNTCRPAEYKQLFPHAAPNGPASLALVPLAAASPATLALGAEDPARFQPDMGQLFLTFVADVLSRALRRLPPSG